MKLEVGKYYRTRNGDKVFLRETGVEGCAGFGEPYGLYLPDGKFGYMGNGRHVGAYPDLDIIAEWTDAPEVGTLKEIGARVGDVVASLEGRSFKVTKVDGKKVYAMVQSEEYEARIVPNATYRIISRAQPGPVRTVTRHEIVPGVYGRVVVDWQGGIRMDATQDADELTAAIATLTAIRDAMQANTTA